MKKYPYPQKTHMNSGASARLNISGNFCQANVTDRRAVNVREFPWFQIENRLTNKKSYRVSPDAPRATLLLQV
jgi:hypothetical protein